MGWPSLKATFTDGPVTCSVTSGWAAGIPDASTARRRGVSRARDVLRRRRDVRVRAICARDRAAPATPHRSSARESLRNRFLAENLASEYHLIASSRRKSFRDHNLSNVKPRILTIQLVECSDDKSLDFQPEADLAYSPSQVPLPPHFLAPRLLLIHPRLRDAYRQRTHPRDHAHSLGHRNRAAGIQNIEQMRAFQAEIVGGQEGKPLLRRPAPASASILLRLLRTAY